MSDNTTVEQSVSTRLYCLVTEGVQRGFVSLRLYVVPLLPKGDWPGGMGPSYGLRVDPVTTERGPPR